MTVYTLPLWESVSGFTVAAPLRLDGIKGSTARDRRSSDVRGRTAGRRTRVLAAAFALARAGLVYRYIWGWTFFELYVLIGHGRVGCGHQRCNPWRIGGADAGGQHGPKVGAARSHCLVGQPGAERQRD